MADATGLASPVIVAANFDVDHGGINQDQARFPTFELLEEDIALIEDTSVTFGSVVSAGKKRDWERNPGAVASSDDDIEVF